MSPSFLTPSEYYQPISQNQNEPAAKKESSKRSSTQILPFFDSAKCKL
jgi:hypothetical protein